MTDKHGGSRGGSRARTMADLARIAGVSAITVSRALADSPLVNATTRERIQALAQDHGYALNTNARNLRLQRTMTIAVVVEMKPDKDRAMSGPYPLELLGGISQVLTAAGYGILLTSLQARRPAAAGAVDGVILLGQGREDRSMRLVRSWGRPMLVWGAVSHAAGQIVVGSDNLQGGRLAAERFIALGRSRPVFLGDPTHGEFAERQQGFVDALAAHGITPRIVRIPAFNAAAGQAAIEAQLEAGPFDAVFASSDLIAIGALRALIEAGLRVPQDVSVIGFDDSPVGASFMPPLSSIHQDFEAAGSLLARKMLGVIAGDAEVAETLPTRLVLRET